MSGAINKRDPTTIFVVGEQYYQASEYLGQTAKAGSFPNVGMPAVVCAAFALELFLKCLLVMESGKLVEIHDLRKLFDKVDGATQSRIQTLCALHLADDQKFVAETCRVAGAPVPTVTFDFLLDMSARAFA